MFIYGVAVAQEVDNFLLFINQQETAADERKRKYFITKDDLFLCLRIHENLFLPAYKIISKSNTLFHKCLFFF